MAKKKKQTIGYKYFASGHFVLCHGPIDAITKILFQDKDAYLNEENTNKTIYINKPSLFGGDEQSGGVQGNIELLFGRADQQKSSTLQRICAKISNAFGGLISAYRGVCSVVFDNVYIGTAPNTPDSKWRVKRIHTRHDGELQWYDEKAEIMGLTGVFIEYSDLSGLSWELARDPVTGAVPNISKSYFFNPSEKSYDLYLATVDFAANLETRPVISGNETESVYVVKNGEYDSSGQLKYWNRYELTISDPPQNFKLNVGAASEGIAEYNTSFSFLVRRGARFTATAQTGDPGYQGAMNGKYQSIFFTDTKIEAYRSESDLNPAHIVRECLTNKVWGIGVSESSIDDVSFMHAADVLFAEEMGMSIKWTDSTSINEFVDNIKEHINAQLYLDRVTSRWKLYLIRDDYNINDLISLDERNIRNLDFERRTLAECVNSVTITYWDRERAKDSTVAVQDIARIAQQGGVISQSIDYKGFTNSGLASRVALRDLKTLSSTLATVSFDVDESFSENWHEGMPFKLSDESYGLSEAVMRIRTIKRGDGINNAVYVEAIEDSFSSPMQSVVEYVPPIAGGDSTAKNATAIVFEVPYIELVEQYGQDEVDSKLLNYPDLGYVGMAAIRPNNQHINASLYVDAGAGYDERTTLDFCPNASLKNDINYMDSSFGLENVAEFELLQANNRIQVNNEIMAFVSFDMTTNIVTVKRGCFDTVPQKHGAGSKLYGWDNYSSIDDLEYLSGEDLLLKALTLTGSDQLALSEATAHIVNVSARAIRPYPPADVKINRNYFPETLLVASNLNVAWSDRNRVQQTGGTAIGWFENSVTVENGVTYSLELSIADGVLLSVSDINADSYVITESTLVQNKAHKLKLWSMRDGYDSYQVFEHSFFIESASLILTATATKSNIVGSTVPTANVSVVVDEALKANMQADGSSISGKAQAGATITIEVDN